ncbi:MAG: alpha-amylase family glycosyl hydrolase [Phycisphaerales bacterium]
MDAPHATTRPPLPQALPDFGATAGPESAHFTVYADADGVRVRLIHPGTRSLVVRDLDAAEHPRIWHVRIPGDFRGWTYTFEITRGDHLQAGVLDPHASLVAGERCVLIDDATPVADPPPLAIDEAIIYELHVRDFTNHPTSGVRPEWRGTYLGLTERGTGVPAEWGGDLSTGLDHLRELGVTVVQLMPVHAFAYVHHNRYDWGYMPDIFTSPHEPYAAATDLQAPVREFRQLVSAIHEAGMRVTIDMVLNHTCEQWPMRRRSLMCLAPKDYFRFDHEGHPSNGSGCGNELASEHPVTRDLIVRACERWVRDYGVDGFRFDLLGLMDIETIGRVVEGVRALRPDALIYGEPWAGGPTSARITHKGDQRGRGFAVFNDEFRDAGRGQVFHADSMGFITHGHHTGEIKRAVRGSVGSFADSPMESINYLEAHDNHTLADRVALLIPKEQGVERLHALMLGAYFVLTSAGVPFLHAGQEFARRQKGIDNAYNHADAINNIDWSLKQQRTDLVDLYRTLIALRLDHPILRLSTREHANDCVRFLDDDLNIKLPEHVVAWETSNPGLTDTWARCAVVLNASREAHTIPLPDHGKDWQVSIIGFHAEDGSRMTGHAIEVPGMSGAIAFQPAG